jgi:hypothetical protein
VIVAAGVAMVTTGVVDRGSIGLANVNGAIRKTMKNEHMLMA